MGLDATHEREVRRVARGVRPEDEAERPALGFQPRAGPTRRLDAEELPLGAAFPSAGRSPTGLRTTHSPIIIPQSLRRNRPYDLSRVVLGDFANSIGRDSPPLLPRRSIFEFANFAGADLIDFFYRLAKEFN